MDEALIAKKNGGELSFPPNQAAVFDNPKAEDTTEAKIKPSTNKFSYWRGRGVWGHSPESSTHKETDAGRALIDTAAPFESVKAAANMFGGTADWKVQKALSMERNKNVRHETKNLDKKVSLYQKQAEEVEEAKRRAIQELEATKRTIEELRLQLGKALTEEAQAKQDSELAQLRVKEMVLGITDEASVAAKAQAKVAKARYLEAVDELKSVKSELDKLRKEHALLTKEVNAASKKADEAILVCKESEKRAEQLTLELLAINETLGLAQESALEEEELRVDAAMSRKEESLNLEQQFNEAEEELRSLNEQISVNNHLKKKLQEATDLISTLETELTALMEAKQKQKPEIDEAKANPNREALTLARKELAEVKACIAKEKDEVSCLRVASSSLESALETEKKCLAVNMESLEANLANGSASAIEIRLEEIMKEIEASKSLDLRLIKAAQECENTMTIDEAENPPTVLSIPSKEYYTLCKRAMDAENLAAMEALSSTNSKELFSKRRLESVYKEKKEKEEILRDATMKAEEAAQGKLKAEQELKNWKQSKRASDLCLTKNVSCCYSRSFGISSDPRGFAPCPSTPPRTGLRNLSTEADVSYVQELKPKKKKSFFPRIIMLFSRKKVQSMK
ncbi:hypothetical protein HPP92_010965 [Vanilla planifolia]|uniref:Uncharacterized protein n=1 Tax=Vanilla planifolia TaxID=51239 RepID=A0A835R4R1_VANPL|nr:hypothetical protein HPP92_010965 [Vanilla planifolia]